MASNDPQNAADPVSRLTGQLTAGIGLFTIDPITTTNEIYRVKVTPTGTGVQIVGVPVLYEIIGSLKFQIGTMDLVQGTTDEYQMLFSPPITSSKDVEVRVQFVLQFEESRSDTLPSP